MRWEYACGRFSDWELRVQRKDKEIWSSVPSDDQHLLPRPAAPLPHLPGEGRDAGGQAARPHPVDAEDAVGRSRPRRGQVTATGTEGRPWACSA